MLNWIKNFFKSKKFKIDKRTVIIINHSRINKETLDSVNKGIQIFCMKTALAKRFPKLTFILENEKTSQDDSPSRDTMGWVTLSEIASNKAIIHLNITFLIEKILRSYKTISASRFYRELSRTATHELTHIIQDKNYKISRRRISTNVNTILSLIKKKKKLTLNVKRNEFTKHAFLSLRVMSQKFIFLLLSEGAAEFFGKMEGKQLYFSTNQHKLEYQYAKSEAIELTRRYNAFLESLTKEKTTKKQLVEIEHLLSESTYVLGCYMFFTIAYIFNDPYTPEDLLSLKPYQFIKLYEKAELKNKQTPVVSLRSNLGYFDYNATIKNWAKTVKELND